MITAGRIVYLIYFLYFVYILKKPGAKKVAGEMQIFYCQEEPLRFNLCYLKYSNYLSFMLLRQSPETMLSNPWIIHALLTCGRSHMQ
jgi:hypothetical protein